MNNSVRCLQVRVYGRVQGVFFRQETCEQARHLGIRGWVMNMPDGTVGALICGNESQLQAMQAWLAQGPAYAHVERIEVQEEKGNNCPQGFHIHY